MNPPFLLQSVVLFLTWKDIVATVKKNINSKPIQTNNPSPKAMTLYSKQHVYTSVQKRELWLQPSSSSFLLIYFSKSWARQSLQSSQPRWSLIFPFSNPIFPVSRACSDSPSLGSHWPFLCHDSHCVIIYICSLVLWSSRGHTAGSLLL